jgi:hypothetical protein
MTLQLEWGLKGVIPEDAMAAWGARAILDPGESPMGLLPDRQCVDSADDDSRAELIELLNGPNCGDGVIRKVQDELRFMLDERMVEPSYDAGHVKLFDSRRVTVLARVTPDYVYVTCWLKPKGSPDPRIKV